MPTLCLHKDIHTIDAKDILQPRGNDEFYAAGFDGLVDICCRSGANITYVRFLGCSSRATSKFFFNIQIFSVHSVLQTLHSYLPTTRPAVSIGR